VYRDKHGRTLTDDSSRRKEAKKGRIKIEEKEQLDWEKGRAQIQAEEEVIRERNIVQNEKFAWFKDGTRLETTF